MRLRRALVLGAGVLVGIVGSATSSGVADRGSGVPSDRFWSSFQTEGVEVNHFDSIGDMVAESDAIVVGRIDQVRLSRQWNAVPEWGVDGLMTFVMASVAVEDETGVGGAEVASSVEVELFLPDPSALPEVVGPPPAERSLFFLMEKEDVPGAYMLASSQGYLRDRGTVVPPVASEDDPWLQRLRSSRFDELVRQLLP